MSRLYLSLHNPFIKERLKIRIAELYGRVLKNFTNNSMKRGTGNIKDTKNPESFHSLIPEIHEFFASIKGNRAYKHVISAVEKMLIEDVLARTGGNQLKASRILGINRNTLHSKIIKLGINIKCGQIKDL